MKRLILTMILGCFFLATAVIASPSVVSEDLSSALSTANSEDYIRVLIHLTPEPDGEALMEYVQGVRASERAAVVWDYVQAQAEEAQEALLDRLYDAEQSGDATAIRSLVIANAIDVELHPEMISEIAERLDVRWMSPLVEEQVLPDEPVREASNELDEIDWGVNQVNAPDVWDLGYTGEGVLVAMMDTGVRYTHLDLVDHMWDGGASYPNHGYDFYNNDDDPWDDHGHGSHTAGSVASDGTAGSQCGVAPDATIMALKVLNAGGSGSYSEVWAAIDFQVEHGADVSSMSLGWHNVDAVSRSTFRNHYVTMNAANIVSVNSAGNDGANQSWYPIPDNVKTPASVPPPWLHPDQPVIGATAGQITVGATGTNDAILYFSSRGPVTWQNESPWFDWMYGGQNDGLIKPDVCAPGDDIKSLNYTSDTGYTFKSGTSMATPLTAGVCALLKSVDINMTPAQIDEYLEMTALELGIAGKDNTYGSGRVDAMAAVLAVGNLPDISITLTPDYDPYYVTSGGGNVVFDAQITNSFTVATPGQIKTLVILPNSNEYPLDTYNVSYVPGNPISVSGVVQNVPGWAPVGTYQYVARAGTTPWVLVDADSFEFIKLGTNSPDEDIAWTNGDWFAEGDDVDQGDRMLPSQFGLDSVYPNPFNPTTSLTLNLPEANTVSVIVFDMLGRQVAELVNGTMQAGTHTLMFDGTNHASGVYFVQAEMAVQTSIQKIVLMK